MKKIGLLLMAVMMLWGCSQTHENTQFMITRDNKIYALYNNEGEKLTDYQYKTFQEIVNLGYIVTNEKDQVGFVDMSGDQTIEFGKYETLEATDHMLYATKKVKEEQKVDNNEYHDNLYILNGDGEVLYTASKDLGIRKGSLPILVQNNEYTVLFKDGKELKKGTEEVTSASRYENSTCFMVNYTGYSLFIHYQDEENLEEVNIKEVGQYQIVANNSVDDKTTILYDKKTQGLIGIDRENKKYHYLQFPITQVKFDLSQNIILTHNQKSYIYRLGGKPIELTSYYKNANEYLKRSSQVYGPHRIVEGNGKDIELKDCQLYPSMHLIVSDIFPVYVRKKGYMYYNFKGEVAIKDVYLDAEPFDLHHNAIVKKDDEGYVLINDKGTVLTSDAYSKIQYIGSSYYAVYNEDGRYGIVDTDGKEVLPIEYTTLPETAFIQYRGEEYLMLNKNGRSYLYDIQDEMKEVFSVEGMLKFEEKGYFSAGNVYYTFDGEVIE